MPLINVLYFILQGVLSRVFVLFCVFLVLHAVSKKYRQMIGKYPETRWTTTTVFKTLSLAIVVQYTLPLFLGLSFYHDPEAFLSPEHRWREGLSAIIFNMIIVGIIWWIVRQYKQKFSALGLLLKSDRSELILAVRAFFGIVICGFVLLKLSPAAMPILPEVHPLKIVSALFFAPFAEEILICGFVYQNFRRKVGIAIGILLSSICFLAIHQMWDGFISIFFSGVILCWLYEKSGSLIPPIIGHFAMNFLAVLSRYQSGKFILLTPWWALLILITIAFTIDSIFRNRCATTIIKINSHRSPQPVNTVLAKKGQIIKNSVRKGWLVGLILILILLFLYFLKNE